MVSFMHFNPGKKILWGTWIGHLVSYVIFVVTASKGIVDSPSLQKMDPFAIAFFVLPAGISGFYIVHSAVLLTGHVNPWTSYFHSGIVFSSSCVLPWIYLVFAMYLTRICWPQPGTIWAALPDVCGAELETAVAFAYISVFLLFSFAAVFLSYLRRQESETRPSGPSGGEYHGGITRSYAMGSLVRHPPSLPNNPPPSAPSLRLETRGSRGGEEGSPQGDNMNV